MKKIYELPDGDKVDLNDISMISKIETRVFGPMVPFSTHSDFSYCLQFKSGTIHYIYSRPWKIKEGVDNQIKEWFFQEYEELVDAWSSEVLKKNHEQRKNG